MMKKSTSRFLISLSGSDVHLVGPCPFCRPLENFNLVQLPTSTLSRLRAMSVNSEIHHCAHREGFVFQMIAASFFQARRRRVQNQELVNFSGLGEARETQGWYLSMSMGKRNVWKFPPTPWCS